jgi:hypothetical protein
MTTGFDLKKHNMVSSHDYIGFPYMLFIYLDRIYRYNLNHMIKKPAMQCVVFSLILVLSHGSKAVAVDWEDWSLALYGGVLLKGNLSDGSLLYTGTENAYLVALAASKKVASYYGDKIDLELEGQTVKHFEDQNHWEFNGLAAVRWLPFPWDNHLDTSFAVGAGLSWATETPKVERRRRGKGQTQSFLTYLMLELEFALPDAQHWSVFSRIHHRSGAFGLFNGVTGGSNALTFGIRYRF